MKPVTIYPFQGHCSTMSAVSAHGVRAVLAGAGVAMMGEASVVTAVLQLTKKPPEEVRLLYLGRWDFSDLDFLSQQKKFRLFVASLSGPYNKGLNCFFSRRCL